MNAEALEKGTRVRVETLNGPEAGTVYEHTNPRMPDLSYLIHWDDDTYGWTPAKWVQREEQGA